MERTDTNRYRASITLAIVLGFLLWALTAIQTAGAMQQTYDLLPDRCHVLWVWEDASAVAVCGSGEDTFTLAYDPDGQPGMYGLGVWHVWQSCMMDTDGDPQTPGWYREHNAEACYGYRSPLASVGRWLTDYWNGDTYRGEEMP